MLTCNDLFIKFYDECVDPPVLRDPVEIFYSISKDGDNLYTDCELIEETLDSIPLREGVGYYYVPELPANLEPGNYKVR